MGLREDETYDCTEALFWRVFQVAFDERRAAYDQMKTIYASVSAPKSPKRLARLIFQRGQLGLALALENADSSTVTEISADFRAAIALDPDEAFYATWLDTMNIGLATVQGKKDEVRTHLAEAWVNVARKPLQNIPSLSGTTIGLPLDTGAPAKTLALLEAWECHPDKHPTSTFCVGNSVKAPYTAPGFHLHMGEAYARMGNKARATELFRAALTAPKADTWKYRAMIEGYLADMDGYMARFAELGQDGDGFSIVYANQSYGCKICHAPNP
jgi:hypothetical protein